MNNQVDFNVVLANVEEHINASFMELQIQYGLSGDISPELVCALDIVTQGVAKIIEKQLLLAPAFSPREGDEEIMVRVIDGGEYENEIELRQFIAANEDLDRRTLDRLTTLMIGERVIVNGFVGHSVLVQRTR